jgi:hypothetical protein
LDKVDSLKDVLIFLAIGVLAGLLFAIVDYAVLRRIPA